MSKILHDRLLENEIKSAALLPDGTISLPNREDVRAFREFVLPALRGNILDIGCGPLPTPGYITILPNCTYHGIDPTDSLPSDSITKHKGYCESLPFDDRSFDVIILATSIDHFIDIILSFYHITRVLKPDGSILVWHATPVSTAQPTDSDRDTIICGVSFTIPAGAVDPFHIRYIQWDEIITTFQSFDVCPVREGKHSTRNVFMEFKYANPTCSN